MPGLASGAPRADEAPAMKRRWSPPVARNVFRLLPPGPHIIAKAMAAGVDTSSRPAIEHWRQTGVVNNTGEVE